ncbi:MAG: Crp/Fnr family transcriptional regulator [Bacteroidota bacterium]
MKRLRVKKGTIIQRADELDTKTYYVLQGLMRSYVIDKNGREHIFMFGPEGWVISDKCPPDQPCQLFIEALEDSVLLVREKTFDSIKMNPEPLARHILVLQERIIMLMSKLAIERYEHFEQTYPNILQRVPQRMIASYLGITPEALSKIRRERARKNEADSIS